jgi:hypothetical protein
MLEEGNATDIIAESAAVVAEDGNADDGSEDNYHNNGTGHEADIESSRRKKKPRTSSVSAYDDTDDGAISTKK